MKRTFKQFLKEDSKGPNDGHLPTVTKDDLKKSWTLKYGIPHDDMGNLIELVEHYDLRDRILDENRRKIYRGDDKLSKSETDVAIVINTTGMFRASRDSESNAYMVCFDKMLHDAGLPERSTSLIVSNSFGDAYNYAARREDVWELFPVEGKSRIVKSRFQDLLLADVTTVIDGNAAVPTPTPKYADYLLTQPLLKYLPKELSPFKRAVSKAAQHQVRSYEELEAHWKNLKLENSPDFVADIVSTFDLEYDVVKHTINALSDLINIVKTRIIIDEDVKTEIIEKISDIIGDLENIDFDLIKSDTSLEELELSLQTVLDAKALGRKYIAKVRSLVNNNSEATQTTKLASAGLANLQEYSAGLRLKSSSQIEQYLDITKRIKKDGAVGYLREIVDKFFKLEHFGIDEVTNNSEIPSEKSVEMWVSGEIVAIRHESIKAIVKYYEEQV